MPTNRELDEGDVLVLRRIFGAELRDKAGVYLYSALVAAILEKDASSSFGKG